MVQKEPTTQELAQIVVEIYKMEKVTLTVNSTISLFVKNWHIFPIYSKQYMPEII